MEFSNLHELGIVVTEWSGTEFYCVEFIRSVCPEKEHLNEPEVVWRNQPQWAVKSYFEKPSFYYRVGNIAGIPFRLHLLRFSPSMKMNFSLDDVLFPFKLGGLILIVDLILWREIIGLESMLDYSKDMWELLDIKGGIGWARTSGLPTAVASIQDRTRPIPTDKIHEILALKPQVPILPYYVDYDTYKEELRFSFTHEYTKLVLSTLVNQIEMGGL